MYYQRNIPGCCSVGLLYGFTWGEYEVPKQSSRSGHFIAIFSRGQHEAFKKVCKKNQLISATRIPGAHGIDLAVCVFKGVKTNA